MTTDLVQVRPLSLVPRASLNILLAHKTQKVIEVAPKQDPVTLYKDVEEDLELHKEAAAYITSALEIDASKSPAKEIVMETSLPPCEPSPFTPVLVSFLKSGGKKMPESREQLKADVRSAHQALRHLLPSSTTFTVSDEVRSTRVYQELIKVPPRSLIQKQAIYALYRVHLVHMGGIVDHCPLEITGPRVMAHLLALLFISTERPGVSINLLMFIDDL